MKILAFFSLCLLSRSGKSHLRFSRALRTAKGNRSHTVHPSHFDIRCVKNFRRLWNGCLFSLQPKKIDSLESRLFLSLDRLCARIFKRIELTHWLSESLSVSIMHNKFFYCRPLCALFYFSSFSRYVHYEIILARNIPRNADSFPPFFLVLLSIIIWWVVLFFRSFWYEICK